MAAAAATAAAAVLLFLPNPHPKPSLPATKSRISLSAPLLSANPLSNPTLPTRRLRAREGFRPCSAVQDVAVAEETGGAEDGGEAEAEAERNRKLYVVNLAWDYSASDIEKLFGECGTVTRVDLIRQKTGKSRGYAFVTLASREEAQAVIDRFDSYELRGRIIRIEFAKSFQKPSPPPPIETVEETGHKIYVSNLAWKVRSVNLRDFFSANFRPLAARVVFDKKKSAGYGFVSFATKEEAEAAVSELNGKELMGRPLRLKISQRKGNESESELREVNGTEGPPEEV